MEASGELIQFRKDYLYRNRCSNVFYRISDLKNFKRLTEKQSQWSLLFTKTAKCTLETLLYSWNYKWKLFCVRHENRRKHNQHFKLLFFTRNLHFVTSNQIATYRKPNLPLASSIYLVFLALDMQNAYAPTSK